MASSSAAQTSTILWEFSTIHLTHLDFGYVDRHFAAAFENDLGSTWTLLDNHGHTHYVTYNMNTLHPRMTADWTTMKDIYHERLDDAHITFQYLGDNHFNIIIYFGPCTDSSKKYFIRMSTYDPESSLFAVKLTKSQCEASHLDLRTNFGNAIRNNGFTEVVLLGHKEGICCKVLVSHTRNSTKFGKGWRQFCTEYGLKEGDVIVFEVQHHGHDITIEVHINGCICNINHPITV